MLQHDFKLPVVIKGVKKIKGVLTITGESPWCPYSNIVIPLANPTSDYDYLLLEIGNYINPRVHAIENFGGQSVICCYITKINRE